MQEVIDGWKGWHAMVREAVGSKVNERTATLQAVRKTVADRDEARELLDRLLSWALANRDTPHEFVTCYTYGSNGDFPKVIVDAKTFLGESVGHVKKAHPDRDGRGKRTKRTRVG